MYEEAYPLPHIEEALDIFKEAKFFFCSLDLGLLDIGCLIDIGDEVPIIAESFYGIVYDLVEQIKWR